VFSRLDQADICMHIRFDWFKLTFGKCPIEGGLSTTQRPKETFEPLQPEILHLAWILKRGCISFRVFRDDDGRFGIVLWKRNTKRNILFILGYHDVSSRGFGLFKD
jgi:hypothetical protein